ncbi:hypothetical protein TRVL_04377 [Trypanosoma vivax]|nr:hypothetical protein TRVL_04377 [Trypanosoma vivax]
MTERIDPRSCDCNLFRFLVSCLCGIRLSRVHGPSRSAGGDFRGCNSTSTMEGWDVAIETAPADQHASRGYHQLPGWAVNLSPPSVALVNSYFSSYESHAITVSGVACVNSFCPVR